MEEKTINVWNVIFSSCIVIAYTLVSILLIHDKSETFWIVLIFAWIVMIVHLIVSNYVIKKNINLANVFFGLSIIRVGYIYFIIQLVFGIIIMFLSISISKVLAIEVVILILYLLAVVSAMTVKNIVVNDDSRVAKKTFYLKALEADVEEILSRVENPIYYKEIDKIRECIKYSDPMSHDSLENIEIRITENINQLKEDILSENDTILQTAKEIIQLIESRNQKCKILK